MKVPESLTEEHAEIFRALRTLAKSEGETGRATESLLRALEPHFEKEDATAMPLLGALAALSNGVQPDRTEVVRLYEEFSSDFPDMLDEHEEVRALIEGVRRAAAKDGSREALDLMDALAHHAAIEEEVLYPAAMMVGLVTKSSAKATAR